MVAEIGRKRVLGRGTDRPDVRADARRVRQAMGWGVGQLSVVRLPLSGRRGGVVMRRRRRLSHSPPALRPRQCPVSFPNTSGYANLWRESTR